MLLTDNVCGNVLDALQRLGPRRKLYGGSGGERAWACW